MSRLSNSERLTPRMRDALQQAARAPIRTTRPQSHRNPPQTPRKATLEALTRRGLLKPSERLNRRGEPIVEWAITEAGRQALEPRVVVRRDRPRFLAAQPHQIKYDYTYDPSKALLNAGEVLDPPSDAWDAGARERWNTVRDRRARARQIGRAA